MSYGQNLQVFNPKKFKQMEKDIAIKRKQLEEIRLEEESQNTRLLKIQQQERGVDNEYKDRKRKMEETQEQLAFEAQKFNDEQKRMNQDLEGKKDSLVMLNDRKKKQEDERFLKEERQTKGKEQERQQAMSEFAKLSKEVQELETTKESLKQYQVFFKKVMDLSKDYQQEQTDDETAIKSLIDRYETLKKKEAEFKEKRNDKEREKDQICQQINELKQQTENETYKFTLDYNKLKLELQTINQVNQQKQSEIEGKLNHNHAIQAEYAQVIIAIKNLYQNIKYKNELIKQQQQQKEGDIVIPEDAVLNTQVIDDKLNFIREEIRYLQLVKQEYYAKCQERGINPNQHND